MHPLVLLQWHIVVIEGWHAAYYYAGTAQDN